MDLHLDFLGGGITGEGNDDVGRFLIRGKYDASNRECFWTKTYPGSHDVYYRGFWEGKGIWGTWEIMTFAHGGFHIWPKGAQDGEAERAAAEAAAPAEAVGRDHTVEVPAMPETQRLVRDDAKAAFSSRSPQSRMSSRTPSARSRRDGSASPHPFPVFGLMPGRADSQAGPRPPCASSSAW